jgi:Predicted permease, DMT superfamily
VFTPVSLQYFSAASLGLLRCGIAATCLLGVMLVRNVPPPPLRALPVFILSGATGFTLYIITFNTGAALLNATTSCVVIAASPIITALLAIPVFRERLALKQWAAIALAFGGILIMFLYEGTFSTSTGLTWMLAASLLISLYNILQRRLAQRFNSLQITAYSFCTGSVLLLFALPEAAAQAADAPPLQILMVCFLGVFPSAAAYMLWARALALAPATSQVTNFMFLTPFLALMLDYAVTGMVPDAATCVGGGVIVSALVFFTRTGPR